MRRNSGLIAQHSALSWGEAILCLSLTIAMVVAGAMVEAQQPKKLPRIGYLAAGYGATESTRMDATRLALRELGYSEGQNIAIEYRYAKRKRDQLSEIA